MSAISSIHALVPFISGESRPFAEQRLLKIGFKTTKAMEAKGIKALSSVCASVPMIQEEEISGNLEALMPHIRTMLESTQDAAARALYEASKGTRKEVRQEEISVQACIAFLAAIEAGSRLSAESIAAWFNGSMAKDISAAIITDALKYPENLEEHTEEQAATVAKHVGVYCDVFKMLAGKSLNRASFGDKQWHRLTQILSMILEENPEDAFAQRLQDRMAVIAKEVVSVDMI